MISRTYLKWLTGVIIVVIAAIAISFYFVPIGGTSRADESAARSNVVQFGNYLKNVSRMASSTQLKQDIQSAYGPFVTPDVLALWQENPTQAPGRLASGSWPDRIEIVSVNKQGESYVVTGNIVMTTSVGDAGMVPVVMQLIKQNGKWLIAVYQEQLPQPETSTPQ